MAVQGERFHSYHLLCTSQIKAQHPPLPHPIPGQPPRHLNFWKSFLLKSPSPGQKALQMPPPPGKLPDYCFNFSAAAIMLLKPCKRALLDNTLTCHEILGIFHIKHIKSNIVNELTITSQVAVKIIFIN